MQFYNQMKWILCKIPVRRDKLLTSNLKRQDYRQYRLNLYFHKFYGRYKKKLDSKNNLTLGHMLTDAFHTCYQVIVFHLIVKGFFRFTPFNKEHHGL